MPPIRDQLREAAETFGVKTKLSEKQKCEQNGGTWDGQQCIYPGTEKPLEQGTKISSGVGLNAPKAPKEKTVLEALQPQVPQTAQTTQLPEAFNGSVEAFQETSSTAPGEVLTDSQTGKPTGFIGENGQVYFGNIDQVQGALGAFQEQRAIPQGINPVGTAANQAQQLQQGQQLAGQVGQFGQLDAQGRPLGGVNVGDAARNAIAGAIPRAIAAAGGAAVLGGGIGTGVAPGIGTGAGAIIGGAAGFISSLVGSMISESKSQRRDIVNSQKRVLDEGKQTMNDWITLAKNDPANRAYYLNQYNIVASQIDQAYRQLKLDTSRDVARFETALPDIAEFEAFYATGGERDFLNQEMQTSLLTPGNSDYSLYEMAYRRGQLKDGNI